MFITQTLLRYCQWHGYICIKEGLTVPSLSGWMKGGPVHLTALMS